MKDDNEKKPIIMAVPGDSSACGYYRVMKPSHLMQMAGEDLTLAPPIHFRSVGQEYIFTQRLCSEKSLKPMVEIVKKLGTKLVVDYDDLIWNYKGEGLPDFNWCKSRVNCDGNTKAMSEYANDVIYKATVSTEYLKDALAQFVDRDKITVMPNRLAASDWLFDRAATIPQEDIFLFAGSNTHFDEAGKKYGDFSQGLIRYMQGKKVFTMGCKPFFMNPAKVFPGVPMTTYPRQFYSAARQSKFVIAPLVDNIFNKCKSPLKLLECAAVGRVCLCSDFEGSPYSPLAHEYQKIPVSATYKAIDYIVERAKAHYGEILEHQYKVLQDYWLDNHIEEYKKLFR